MLEMSLNVTAHQVIKQYIIKSILLFSIERATLLWDQEARRDSSAGANRLGAYLMERESGLLKIAYIFSF